MTLRRWGDAAKWNCRGSYAKGAGEGGTEVWTCRGSTMLVVRLKSGSRPVPYQPLCEPRSGQIHREALNAESDPRRTYGRSGARLAAEMARLSAP